LPLIGQRLTVGAEHRLATGTSGTATVARTTTTATTGTARTATLATITTETTGTTRAARTTRTARTIATWTTAAATRAAAIATAEVTRRGGQLPTDSRARHLAATGTIVFLLLFFLRADLEAAEAARLVAITATAGATAATATTTAATSAITAAIIAIVATSARRTGDAIDDVVELAARDRTVRSLLALEHADETDLIDAVPDDVERFDQPRCAIGLHRELRRERLHDRIILRRGRRRLGHACLGRFGSGLDAFRAFRGFRAFRARFTITLRRRLGCCLGRWLLLDRRRRRRRSAGHLGTRLRGFAQGQRREFRERLHAG
jgi:hypothetical protein